MASSNEEKSTTEDVAPSKTPMVDYLVVDSGAFIRNSPIHEMGKNIYTIEEVVSEIRDETTRSRLQVLPYEIHFKEPLPENIRVVSDFARKTGDFFTLSKVDLKLLALAYELEEQFNGTDHLRTNPLQKRVTDYSVEPVTDLAVSLPGFYVPKKTVDDEAVEGSEPEDADEEEDADDDDDEAGWITLGNLQAVKKQMEKLTIAKQGDDPKLSNTDRVTIGCTTTDFAMQNVLLQMGLRLMSPSDGAVIRETRNYILRCHACFKTTTNMESRFCKSCGNQGTLKRVAVTTNERGEQVIHINFKRPINIRGTRYSLPMPKSGKHAANPITAADQPVPQNRATKFALLEKRATANGRILTDPEYNNRTNPFALNDVYSRSARLGYSRNTHSRGGVAVADDLVSAMRPRNPNMSKPSTGNRKKKRNDP